jgi:hypothetical protein
MSKNHIENEFEILEKTTPDAIILDYKKEILNLYKTFAKSGQSGGSAYYTIEIITSCIKKLLSFETIAPLTGEDDEWYDVSDISGEYFLQNIRDSRVFRDKNGAFFIDAIIFDGNIGGSFTSNDVENVSSHQHIKEFPFEPKTFRIDVLDYRWKDKDETTPDENGDWWTHKIKDTNQLKEVYEYYKRV